MDFFVETKRLNLTPFKMEDCNQYFDVISEEMIRKYTPYASSYTVESTLKHLYTYTNGDFINNFYIAIRLKKSNEIIGAILAVKISSVTLDITYLVGKEFRGKGYGTEAFKGFISYLYQINPSPNYRLNLVIEDENISSKKIALSCGAKPYRSLFRTTQYMITVNEDTFNSL